MEQAAALLVLATLGAKILDVIRFARAQDWSSVLTQALAWGIGIVLTFVAAASDQFSKLVVPGVGVPLTDLDGWAKVLVGTSLLSALSVAVDFKKAIDNTQSAAVPSLSQPKAGIVTDHGN